MSGVTVSTKSPRVTYPTLYLKPGDTREKEVERLARRTGVQLINAAVCAQLLCFDVES
jgi:hypothetical protein